MVKLNCVVLSAIFCAIALYGKFITVRNTGCKAVVSVKNISMVQGSLASSPARLSSGNVYSATMSVQKVSGVVGTFTVNSSAKGFLPLLIPSKIIEFYSGAYFEQGENLCLKGAWNEQRQCFQVSSLENCLGYTGRIYKIRAVCRRAFKRLLSSWGNAGGLIISLLSGSREYLMPDVEKSFRNAGLSHILALSGMHLSFMASFTGLLYSKIFGKKYEPLAKFSGILLFVWFAGFSPSLFRAFLFSMIIMILTFFKCRIEKDCFVSVLAVAFLLHIVIRPQDVFTVAFMLSYTALLGILVCGNFIMQYIAFIFPPYIANSVSSSASAFIATSPVCICEFGSVNPIGIIATVIVSPLISLFFVLAVVGIVFSLIIPFLSPIFSVILNVLYCLIMFFVRFFARG